MPVWTWTYEDAEGRVVQAPLDAPAEGFGAQADAETWIGEHWRHLLAAGAEQAHLHRDDTRVYGPMSLTPPG